MSWSDEESNSCSTSSKTEEGEQGLTLTQIKMIMQGPKQRQPAYWETELSDSSAKPSKTFYFKSEQMKVLARSRDGQFVACTTSEEEGAIPKLLVLRYKRISIQQQKAEPQEEDEWSVVREMMLRTACPTQSCIIITDSERRVTLEASLQEEDGLLFFETSKRQLVIQVPPATVMMRMQGCVWCVALQKPEEEEIVLGGVRAQALGSFMERHVKERRRELTEAFCRLACSEGEPEDFMLSSEAYDVDPVQFPSLLTVVKTTVRPSFSLDKGPRVGRSPPLSEEEETEVSSPQHICVS